MASTVSKGRVIGAGLIGNVLEWYDFAAYGFLAPIFADLFFPSEDPVLSLIGAYGAFAAGFLMRPVGGALFGHIGDKLGRKKALTISVAMMAIPTFCIALLPTSATIGIAAAVLMVVLRMAQGLAVGGEFTSSIVFLAEHAPPKRRGFFSSWALFGATGGTLLGSAAAAAVAFFLTEAELQTWGWRIPFAIGLLVAFVGVFIRRGIPDEPEFKKPKTSPVITAFKTHWRQIFHIAALNVMSAVAFYTIFIYVTSWLVSYVQEPRSDALDINTVSMAFLMILTPICGLLSDKIGRKKMLLLGSAGMVLFAWPLVMLMHHPDMIMIFLGQGGFAILIAVYMGAMPATMSEAFPKDIRVSSVCIGYNVAFAAFGGTAPIVAVWLINRTHDDLAFSWYLMAAALISFVAAYSLKHINRMD